jgi:hypothetical protein
MCTKANGLRSQQNMNSNLEHNWDEEQELYEMPNISIISEPRNLWIEEWPTWHWVSLVEIGSIRGVWVSMNMCY